MNVTKNIGVINALIRITLGLTIVAWSTAKMVKCPWRDSYLFTALLGAMKVGEGIVRFCPLTALYQETVNNQNQSPAASQHSNDESNLLTDEVIPYNPT